MHTHHKCTRSHTRKEQRFQSFDSEALERAAVSVLCCVLAYFLHLLVPTTLLCAQRPLCVHNTPRVCTTPLVRTQRPLCVLSSPFACCARCPNGSYSAGNTSQACSKCDDGLTTAAAGATAAAECIPAGARAALQHSTSVLTLLRGRTCLD